MIKRIQSMFMFRSNWTIPYAIFLAIFVAMPLILIFGHAFTDAEGGLSFANFVRFITHTEELYTLIYSVGVAIITTVVCIVLGYPVAWVLSNKRLNKSKMLIVLFILPMWINILIRTLATVALFDFMSMPLGEGALIFGMVYNFIPFMIYPIYNTLTSMDGSLVEAAQDLGAKESTIFAKVILPLSLPGVVSGAMMVFMPTISTFAIAELLTMNNIKLFGTTIQDNLNIGLWNYGAALSLIMLVIIGITMLLSGNNETSKDGGLI